MASDVSSPPSRFFVMKHVLWSPHDTEFSSISSNRSPAPRCPQCGDPFGTLIWLPPYQGELELHGQDFGDLIQGPCGGLLVTERFAEAFKDSGLKGLSGFHLVEVLRVRRKGRSPKPGPPPRYLFVTPAHGQPAVDMERSRIRGSRPMKCTWCRYVGPDAIDGFTLEAGTWNGEDVFRPRGLRGLIVVSERFMRFAEKQAMSHMTLVPIEKYVWDPLGLYYPHSLQQEPPSKG